MLLEYEDVAEAYARASVPITVSNDKEYEEAIRKGREDFQKWVDEHDHELRQAISSRLRWKRQQEIISGGGFTPRSNAFSQAVHIVMDTDVSNVDLSRDRNE